MSLAVAPQMKHSGKKVKSEVVAESVAGMLLMSFAALVERLAALLLLPEVVAESLAAMLLLRLAALVENLAAMLLRLAALVESFAALMESLAALLLLLLLVRLELILQVD